MAGGATPRLLQYEWCRDSLFKEAIEDIAMRSSANSLEFVEAKKHWIAYAQLRFILADARLFDRISVIGAIVFVIFVAIFKPDVWLMGVPFFATILLFAAWWLWRMIRIQMEYAREHPHRARLLNFPNFYFVR